MIRRGFLGEALLQMQPLFGLPLEMPLNHGSPRRVTLVAVIGLVSAVYFPQFILTVSYIKLYLKRGFS